MTFRTRSRVRSAGRTLPRPHTALGLTGSSTRRTSHSQSLAGFDVHEYFRQNGPGAELTVGVNGQPSRDQALLNYVQKCKAEALLDATEDARVRVDDSNSVQGATHSPGRHVPVQRVPLCWDSTLHETEVKMTKVPYQCRRRPQTAVLQSKPLVASQRQSTCSLTSSLREMSDYDEPEDEDKLDMEEIAQKYPDLCILDIEEDTQGREGRGEEVMKRMQPLTVFISPRSTACLDKKKTDVEKECNNFPSPSPSAQSYANIVRKRLAHFLH